MAEIVLNRKDNSGQNPIWMTKETLESILKNLLDEKYLSLTLHGDWSNPPEYSERLFRTLIDRKVPTKLSTESFEGLKPIEHLINDNFHIELCLHRETSVPEKTTLAERKNISFFLPIDQPSPDGSLYEHIITKLPAGRKVIPGINWKNRLSGPEPIHEDDYNVWADTAIAILDQLTSQKIPADFACGLKLCMFSRKQLGHLPTKLVNWPIASCQRSRLFYTLEGNLQPCPRLTPPENMTLDSSTNLLRAGEIFDKWLMPYSSSCYESDTFDCRSLKVGSCQVGCVQHTIEEWQS